MSDKIGGNPPVNPLGVGRVNGGPAQSRGANSADQSANASNSTVLLNAPGNPSAAMTPNRQGLSSSFSERDIGAGVFFRPSDATRSNGSKSANTESTADSASTGQSENYDWELDSMVDVNLDSSDEDARAASWKNVSDNDLELAVVGSATEATSSRVEKDLFCGSATFDSLTSCKGPGGCCLTWLNTSQLISAGVAQGVSTALTFGTKPFVEAAVFAALTPLMTPLAAKLVAAIVSGVYVGAVHSAAGRVGAGLVNVALQGNSYQNNAGALKSFAAELGTIDAPVMAAFVAGYSVRGELTQDVTNIWALAGTMTLTSTASGIFQGLVTDALRQALVKYTEVYKKSPPPEFNDSEMNFVVKSFKEAWSTKSDEKFFHDIIGKIIGGAAGMAAVKFFGSDSSKDFQPSLKGGTAMAIFLTGWFTGIHGAQAVGKVSDKVRGRNDQV